MLTIHFVQPVCVSYYLLDSMYPIDYWMDMTYALSWSTPTKFLRGFIWDYELDKLIGSRVQSNQYCIS